MPMHWNEHRVKSVTLYIPQRFSKIFSPRLSQLWGSAAKEELFRIASDYQKTEPELSYNAYTFAMGIPPTADKVLLVFIEEAGR